jgi:hypothetical protein
MLGRMQKSTAKMQGQRKQQCLVRIGDGLVMLHQLALERYAWLRQVHPVAVMEASYAPVGLFQSPAASGLSGDALFGSVDVISISYRTDWTGRTAKQRLQGEKDGVDAVYRRPLVLEEC